MLVLGGRSWKHLWSKSLASSFQVLYEGNGRQGEDGGLFVRDHGGCGDGIEDDVEDYDEDEFEKMMMRLMVMAPRTADANLRTPIHLYRMWRPAGGKWVEGESKLPWEEK